MVKLCSLVIGCIWVLVSPGGRSANGAELEPRLRAEGDRPRVGQVLELTVDAAAASADSVRVIVRSRGAQQRLEPVKSVDGKLTYRTTPQHAATYMVATTIEPPADAAERTWRFEKWFFRLPGPDASGSASATARFPQTLELTPLVDPMHVPLGTDLPIRVKFNDADLKDAKLRVQKPTRANEPPAVIEAPATNAQGLTNIRIDAAGVWTLSLVHTAARERAPDAKPDRFESVMTFAAGGPQADGR